MQHFPSNVTKRADFAGKSTAEILEANKDFAIAPPMAKNTMAKGYVANVKTMMRHGMQDHKYRDPFADAQLSYPKAYLPSKPREGISIEVTNRVFDKGVKSNLLDEAMFPLLGKLTSRRLGLLTYLQGSDIRKKDGVWIARTNSIVEVENKETRKQTWEHVMRSCDLDDGVGRERRLRVIGSLTILTRLEPRNEHAQRGSPVRSAIAQLASHSHSYAL
jgi:hypothetical protein